MVAVVLTITLPAVAAFINRSTGLASITWLRADGLSLLGWWTLPLDLYHLDVPNPRGHVILREYAAAVVIVLVLMALLFLATPIQRASTVAGDAWQRDETASSMVLYHLLYLSFVGSLARYAISLLQRYAAVVEQRTLRVRLRLYPGGLSCALGYVCSEGARVVILRSGVPVPLSYLEFTTLGAVFVGVTFVTAALTLPLWARWDRPQGVLPWIDNFCGYRQLYPLWRDLYRAFPAIAYLTPPRSLFGDIAHVDDLRFRLCRRAVEIRDGIVRLRPCRWPPAERCAAELCKAGSVPDEEAAFVVAAASMMAALHAHRTNYRAPVTITTSWHIPGGANLDNEILVLVRHAYHDKHSPVVRATRRRFGPRQQRPSVNAALLGQ